MPIRSPRPAALTSRVFRGSEALRQGLLSPDDLRSHAWTRIRHDVYADASLERDHRLACQAALLHVPATTVIAGPSAAFLHGVLHAATFTDDVHVITPRAVRVGVQQRLRVHQSDLTPSEIVGHRLRFTSSTRTAWDSARWLATADAVPIVDAMLGRGLVTHATLADQLSRQGGRRGWRRARDVFALADAGAQSPAESRLRVRLEQAGLPRPVTQCPIRVSAGPTLHADLGWPEWQVAVEYDGQWHATADQLHRDRVRLNRLVAAGWTILHVTHRRQQTDFPGVVAEITAALIARGWRPTHGTGSSAPR